MWHHPVLGLEDTNIQLVGRGWMEQTGIIQIGRKDTQLMSMKIELPRDLLELNGMKPGMTVVMIVSVNVQDEKTSLHIFV